MELRKKVTEILQEMREEQHSWRSIASYWDISEDWANLRRIYIGGNVGDHIVKRVALAMGIVHPRPRLDAYRPVIQPSSLSTVATGKEIENLLLDMNIYQVDMEYVLMALHERMEYDAQCSMVRTINIVGF